MNQKIKFRKNTENKMIKAKNQTEMMSKAKSKVIADMSHELRTPLNSIIKFSKIMMKGHDPDNYNRILNNILLSSEHLLKLINDILDLSKIEAGEMELKMKLVQVNNLISECLKMVSIQANEKRLKINYSNKTNTDLSVTADKDRLQQVIMNLLSNAIKFTNQDGEISIISQIIDNELFIDIIDNGIGIDEKNLEYIFDAYEQVRSGIKSKNKRTGLGLHIAKKIVEMHKGTISVKSKIDVGSTFTIKIPTTISSVTNNQTKVISTEIPLPEWTKDRYILIVDDETMNLNLLSTYFNIQNQKHLNAKNGIEGIELTQKYPVELVLMDIKMRGMDGIEAMKRIKSEKDIPIIALTALAMEGSKNNLIDYGFDGYISKPFDFNELNKIITIHMDRRGKRSL